MTYKSFNEYHLGDNLIHLHFLRKLALAHPEHIFEHAVHAAHREQLLPIVEDLSNVRLTGIGHPSIMDDLKKDRAWRNVWKNANDRWGRHPRRNQFAEYYLGWFSDLAHEMGLPTPFHKPADLLFDYPAIGRGGRAANTMARRHRDGAHRQGLLV